MNDTGRARTSALVSAISGVIALALGVLSIVDGRSFDATLGFAATGMAFTATFLIWRRQTNGQ